MSSTDSPPSAESAASRLPPGPGRGLPFARLWTVRRIGLLQMLTDMAARYGDVVYFHAGRPLCLVNDPEVIRRILVTDAARFAKSHILRGAKAALGEGLLTSDGELHKTQRRMIAPVFHAQAVKAYAEDFVAQAMRTADAWRDGQTLDVGREMTGLTLRVVTRSLFGTDLESDVGEIGEDMAAIVEMFERVRNPLAFLLDRLPLPVNRRFKAAMTRLDGRIDRMIRDRQRKGTTDRFDLLTLLLAARDAHAGGSGGGMTETQVSDEAVTLFLAGHETTANALIWTWLLLAEHPSAAAALHAELDAVLGDRPATADDVPNLKYTRAVVAESMRLRPPAWIIARLCTDAYDVGPYRLPAETTILMCQYLVHRDRRWWPDAEQFKPERWLADAADRPKYAYFPFGGGPRSCIGEPFAWMEAILLLATLAQRWRLERADDKPVRLFPTITLRPRDPVRMTVRSRSGL